MNLPSNLLCAICNATMEQGVCFDPLWATVHQQTAIEDFNATLELQILLLHTKYRLNPPALADWVSTKSRYKVSKPIGNEEELGKESEEFRPLNSWILKDPVGMIPSKEEIIEETEWKNFVSRTLFGKQLSWHIDDVHGSYVRQACAEVLCFERLLIEWRHFGSVNDQEEWSFSSKEERTQFRGDVKRQRINVLNAKQKLELFQKNNAPDFLISQAAGAGLREKRLLDQMQVALTHSH